MDQLKRFRIVIAYDGTDFLGWQQQPCGGTVSQCLQASFHRVFGHEILLIGASRTDSGVHAFGQVATFQTGLSMPNYRMLKAWNQCLPSSIHIRSLHACKPEFHPCFNVSQKIYWYTLFLRRALPFEARFGWLYQFIDQVDLEKFEKALQIYRGEHDFGSFCKQGQGKSTIRTIDEIVLKRYLRRGILKVVIKGKSFLHFQIRRMVGYALDVARQSGLSLSFLRGVLDNPNPRQTLLKAGASGLCLRKVVYNNGVSRNK